MAARCVVVRHGETEWSLSGRHTGLTDVPLIEAGRARAAEVATELAGREFALVLTSPLRRARETCELAGFGAVAEICEDLHEWDYGEYEGLTTPEIRERAPDWYLWRDGCPGGETPAKVGERADRVRARLDETVGEVLLFAHGHILRVLAARWIELEVQDGARFTLAAGFTGTLGYERAIEAIERWNARA
jgi:broad specificity phosphatase PhoE